MKMIPKMQLGGGFLSLFADYNLVPRPLGGQPTSLESKRDRSGSTAEEKGKLTEKDLFTMLKEIDGLPNETEALYKELSSMYLSISYFGGGFGALDIADIYMDALSKMKLLLHNKKEFDNAYTEVLKNLGLNEAAIDGYGRVFVLSIEDGKPTFVTVLEYLNNKDSYKPITNKELLQYRAKDPQFIHNNEMFNIINNGIGINKVAELIRTNMRNLGTSELSITGYTAKAGLKVMLGLKVLEDLESQQEILGGLLTLDGIYKSKHITKELKAQAEAALQYIYLTLPENAKTILLLHSNNADNPTTGAIDLVSKAILSGMNTTNTIENDFLADLNIDGSKKSTKSGDSLDDEDVNVAEMFLMGLGKKDQFMINPGTNLATNVSSSSMLLVNTNLESLGANCSLLEASEGLYSGILNWNEVTMGGHKVDSSQFNKIIINDGIVYKIDFPVDENGNPDLRPTTIETKKKVDAELKETGIDVNDRDSIRNNYQKVNQIMRDNGVSAVYNNKGEIVSGNWRTFAVMNGTTDKRALDIDPLDDDMLISEVTDETKIDSITQILHDKTGLSSSEEYQFNKKGWLSWAFGNDSLVEGTVWIPINNNYHNAKAGSKSLMSAKLNNLLEERLVEMDTRLRFVKGEQP